MNKGGYSYSVTREELLEYMKLTTEEKLQWLEEMLIFTAETSTPETRKIRDFFRKGKVD
jgi:hypothetical protein